MVKFTVNFPVLEDTVVAGSKTQGTVKDKMELIDMIVPTQSRIKRILNN